MTASPFRMGRAAGLAGLLLLSSQVQALPKPFEWADCSNLIEMVARNVDIATGALPSIPAADARRITDVLDQARRLPAEQSHKRAQEAYRMPNYDLWALRDSLRVASQNLAPLLAVPRQSPTREDVAKAIATASATIPLLVDVKDRATEVEKASPSTGPAISRYEVNNFIQSVSAYIGCASRAVADNKP